ncbi:hypothetical protein D9M69_664570 [compost metagenome]
MEVARHEFVSVGVDQVTGNIFTNSQRGVAAQLPITDIATMARRHVRQGYRTAIQAITRQEALCR